MVVKLFNLATLLLLISNCIQFKESKLDPNGPISQILGIYNLMKLSDESPDENQGIIDNRCIDSNLIFESGNITPNNWTSVTYGDGKFVAITSNTDRFAYSLDGEIWEEDVLPFTFPARSIAYGDGKFVAIGSGGEPDTTIIVSEDLETWSRPTAEPSMWFNISYLNNRFIGVGLSSSPNIIYSTDTLDWSILTAPSEINTIRSIAFGNGNYVAVASGGTNRVMSSQDGIAWNTYPVSQDPWWSITFGNDQFVAIAQTGENRVMTSVDGVSWEAYPAPEQNNWISIAYGGGRFVAIANNGTNQIMTSVDGTNWDLLTAPVPSSWSSVTYGDGKFVAVATAGGVMYANCD